jgi:ABC-2 type transport system ATP-binding protein
MAAVSEIEQETPRSMKPDSESFVATSDVRQRKALEVCDVCKTFYPPTFLLRKSRPDDPRVKQALNNVSLEINEGEMVALLGPNGAGKTTLSKVITTLMHPSSGEVRLFGVDVRQDSYAARGMMGFVTCDERSFYWRLTGRQNLNFFGALYGVSKADIKERSGEILETLDLTIAADRPYHSYSSGMKQKLAIARGLMSHPRMMIYDEPTRSLDPLSAHNIRSWIQEQRRKDPQQTHLLATNQLHEAELLCDRVIIIFGGKIIAQGTVAQIHALADISEIDSFHIETTGGQFQPAADFEQRADVTQLRIEATPNGQNLTLAAANNSEALNSLLSDIIRSGDIVIGCETQQVSFDEVFCSVIEAAKAKEAV